MINCLYLNLSYQSPCQNFICVQNFPFHPTLCWFYLSPWSVEIMEPEEVDIDQEDSELESSVTVHRKKSRIKKIREKWNALFFIPIDVINKKSNRSRDGLQAYKELVCKACSYVFHNRANIKVHTEKYHRNAFTNCVWIRNNFSDR